MQIQECLDQTSCVRMGLNREMMLLLSLRALRNPAIEKGPGVRDP